MVGKFAIAPLPASSSSTGEFAHPTSLRRGLENQPRRDLQVPYELLVLRALVGFVLGAQQGGRVDGDHQTRAIVQIDGLAAYLGDGDGAAEQAPRRGGAERHHDVRLDDQTLEV